MVQIIETIDVDVPVRTAYNQWTQFESFPKFLDEVVSITQVDANTTRVTVQLDWAPEGLLEKVGALVGAGSHAVKKDLKNFKEFIEGRGVETGAWRGDVDA